MATITSPPSLGLGIRLLRITRGLSQEDLARRIGLAVSSISRIERDQHLPTPVEMAKLQVALGVVPPPARRLKLVTPPARDEAADEPAP